MTGRDLREPSQKNDASPDRDAARRRRQQAGRLRRPYCLKGAGSPCPVSFPSKEWSAGRRQGLARPLNGPGEGPFARRYGQACEACPRGARPLWREGAAPPGAPPRRGRPAAPLPPRCRRRLEQRRPRAGTATELIPRSWRDDGEGALRLFFLFAAADDEVDVSEHPLQFGRCFSDLPQRLRIGDQAGQSAKSVVPAGRQRVRAKRGPMTGSAHEPGPSAARRGSEMPENDPGSSAFARARARVSGRPG